MCFAEAPEADCDAVKAQLLKVDAAGPQGCHQQPVYVLTVDTRNQRDNRMTMSTMSIPLPSVPITVDALFSPDR